MSFRDTWRRQWRSGLAAGAVAVVLGRVFLAFGVGDWLKEVGFSIPFRLRGNLPVEDAVIVSMDESSHTRLGQTIGKPWHRALHIQLLGELKARGAKAVVLDILLDKPWPDVATDELDDRLATLADAHPELKLRLPRRAEVDPRLAEEMAAHGRVVLASKVQRSDVIGLPPLFTEIGPANLAAGNVRWGVVNLDSGVIRTNRRYYADENYTTVAWQVAALLGRTPTNANAVRLFKYYGRPPETIPHVSYYQVLERDALPGDYLSNKVVFVGLGRLVLPTGEHGDEHPGPYREPLQGAEILATATLNLLRGDWLNVWPPLAENLLLATLGLLFGIGLNLPRPGLAAVLALGGILAVTFGGCWLMWQERVWFPWSIVAGVQIPCVLAWSVVANTRRLVREKSELESKLATAIQASEPGVPSPRAPPAESPADARRMPAIPDHTLLRCVGRGAYGEVWLARDLIGNFRAVKIVYRNTFTSDQPYDREFRGIEKYSPISRLHPGWIDILHVGRNDAAGYFFYIMEIGDDETTGQKIDPDRYSSRTLASELRERGRLPFSECLQLGLALADALEFLHQHQLIHRDVKPSNVLFVNGLPKFTDIGLVTRIGSDGKVSCVGTEGYLAPEGPGTAAADVYSLGILIYETSMGRDRQLFPELPSTLTRRGDKDDLGELHEILMRACETDPRERIQSAAEFRAALLKLQGRVPSERRAP